MSNSFYGTPKKRRGGLLRTPHGDRSGRAASRFDAKRLTSTAKKRRPFTPHSERNSRMASPFCADRFIPKANVVNPHLQELKFNKLFGMSGAQDVQNCPLDQSSSSEQYKDEVAKELFNGDTLKTKVLKFKQGPRPPSESYHSKLRVLYSANRETKRVRRKYRHISSHPERVLDAPDILDDYYINVLDWSSSDVLAIGLGSNVYLWHAPTGKIDMLMECEDSEHMITSVSWMADGSHIAIGSGDKTVQIWDIENKRLVRKMKGHQARIGALSWNNHILTSGSRDTCIMNHDVRIAQHCVSTFNFHTEEICGLRWSPDGSQLASGGNDNQCCIWELSQTAPKITFTEHQAAVKALAWSPHHRNLLATGAGTADRCIRFYNTGNGELLRKTNTGSQVCSLQWSKSSRELVSAHGYSMNQIIVWNYPTMSKVAELTGHSKRVLHTTLSSDGTTLCSAAADETLRFWKIFDTPVKKKQEVEVVADKRGSFTRHIR